MAIHRIFNDRDCYQVGMDDVSKIEITNHSEDKKSIYKVTYTDSSILFVGFLNHKVEKQATIFDYL